MSTPASPPAYTSARRVTSATPLSLWASVIGLCLLLLIASMPWWAERSTLRLGTEFLCVLALAQMWNLLAGYGGLASMGQQAFVGLGAYCLVVFGLQWGLPVFWIVPVAGVIGALVAVPTALVVFRLRGAYFAIGTWVVAEVFRLLITNLPQVSGGSGLSIAPLLSELDVEVRDAWSLWLALTLGAGGTMALYALLRSRWGLALTAVRDSEPASESLGVSVPRIKWMVYIAAGAASAMVGALLFITKLRVSPDAAFSMEWTSLMFFAVVIGGIGTLEGPILGALVYFALREWLSDQGSWYLIVLGLLTVAVVLWAPGGIWGALTRRWDIHLFPVRRRVLPLRER
ncbi:MAG: branched-chain amino acid ABC transporter permease [Hydrogenophaga sp.]|uniref:branched-chain amino acid ABC transporter permease n=1 Tax=Hydrogenophaga sp. TaxID=1904254 RepID=UPI00271C3907|nr:branched-chain amino acid ABC transporter permease [Hydrogenophaga sp.]MDO9031928.1 branched-chain amino acid ABC transporter permease [Hydrogenophaga sp.]